VRAEVVAVGSELLLGDHVDTNSAWISSRLSEIGVDVHRHTTVGDNLGRLAEVLAEAVGRADAVIVTGGLGPTQDDLTRQAVAAVAGVGLVRDEDLVQYVVDYFARGGREMPERNLVQADLPEGARVLAPVGTAAGFAVDLDASPKGGGDVTIYCVPGVPTEMEQMVARDVVPELAQRGGLATTISRVVRTAGMSESGVADRCARLMERLDEVGNPTIAFLASKGQTRVRVTAKAADREQALALLAPVVDEVVATLGEGVVGVDEEDIEHAVARQLRQLRWTLAVGESITGGGLGARLVRVAGASDWFRGGLITYATATKSTVAGVDARVLEEEGPVSEAVVGQLAEAARKRFDADAGLAVVGVAGPTAQGGRAVGTVCAGVVLPDGQLRTRTLRLPGRERTEVQAWAAGAALEYLRRRLAEAIAQAG
jgi:nicotinamide-nucleotide amidase